MRPLRVLVFLLAMTFIRAVDLPVRADTLDDIQKTGVLHVGTGVMGLKPWMWQEPNGDYAGIEADLIRAIAKELGAKPDIVTTEWSTLIPGLKTNRWDVIISAMAKSEERIQGGGIQFSNPYILSYDRILVKADSPAQKLEDMKGKILGSTVGSLDSLVGHSLADRGFFAEVKDFNSFNEPFVALQNDQVDAVIIDQHTFTAQKEQFKGLRAIGDPQFFIPKPEWAQAQAKADYILGDYAIGVRKEDDRLREQLNAILAKFDKDGTRKAILEKYGVWSQEQVNLMKH
jgi:ABC-type amino acid transport substrate-binding protein